MRNKMCIKCKQLKPITEFYERKVNKDKLTGQCKSCIIKDVQKRQQQNLECYKEYKKKYRETHICEIQEYYKNNKDKYLVCMQKWRQENREYYLSNRRKYESKRRKDIKHRLNKSISTGILQSLKGNKNGQHWKTLLNYTLEELQICLEKQWTGGMTWQNYGSAWHIDHRIPISAFNFSKPEHLDFKRCWALSNLQPMWASENISKSNKLAESFQPSLQL